MNLTYRDAGVDIDAGNRAVELIKEYTRATFRPEVLTDIGTFGAMFALSGGEHGQETVLVASVDGVGTKLKLAFALDKHDTVGIDLVNHCVNDILTGGAQPLFFLDYFATGRLVPEQLAEVVKGLSVACRQVGCALIGGETAEMPDFYAPGEYDLAGFIVGLVHRDEIVDGSRIVAGDVAIALPSSGLHTNGYSLVRRIFGLKGKPSDAPVLNRYYSELGHTLGEELLTPHRCYLGLLRPLLPRIKGMAHITGGGLVDNVPRILPKGLAVRVEATRWCRPPIFDLIQATGQVAWPEMYRTFNMGVGMLVICSQEDAPAILAALPDSREVGEVVPRQGERQMIVE